MSKESTLAPVDQPAPIRAEEVARAHDAMVDEYDRLDDLWYPWLYSQIHELIARNLPLGRGRLRALDVGCGTGFQSFLLARAGHDVEGFDLASKLLAMAVSKVPAFARPPLEAPPLFEARHWPPAASHHRRIAMMLERAREHRRVAAPRFQIGDLRTYPFLENTADLIVCCGSVLSLVEDYAGALERMGAALRPGGRLFIDVEQRWNLDLLWPAVDRLLGGRLEYDQSWPDIRRGLIETPGRAVRLDYPFELNDGQTLVLPMWIFSVGELERLFRSQGLTVRERLGVHWATNLIPSTVLHQCRPTRPRRWVAQRLASVDGTLGRLWPMWRLGCTVSYCLERR